MLGIVLATVRVAGVYEPDGEDTKVAFRSTVPSSSALLAGAPPRFVTVAFSRIVSPGLTADAFATSERERRGARIVTEIERAVEARGTPLWSVPLNAISVTATVPSGVPPLAEAVTLNEYARGAMLLNA
jgi:hypothetical protein